MSIAVGTQLGSYTITVLLGKGGMGEVYRARDAKLKREVAIKILPAEFSLDADRVSRFQREAEVLASLNQPHIAAIYDVQESDGFRFLVLELVEGETLAERIQRGPVPVDEALHIAKSICEAVEAAHEKGIVHRDLKPANVKITPEGAVKVLDFGLAKAMSGANASPAGLSNSPTLSMGATNPGIIIGTAAYMSPEQARGRNADHRSDVFSIGCIIYEMLTGRQAFDGEDVSEVLASVLKSQPDLAGLPSGLSPQIRRLIRRCLEKNPKLRWQAAGDVRLEIEEVLAGPQAGDTPTITAPVVIQNRRREWFFGAVAAAAIAGLVVSLAFWAPWRAPAPAAPLRLSAELGADVGVAGFLNANSALALSPDGSMLAFVGVKQGGAEQIYVRRLGQLQASPLAGTVGGRSPFFSPDGQWLAFSADGMLKKISVTGGAAVALCEAPSMRGGSWGDDGNIVFTPSSNPNTSLLRVSSGGGKPEPLTKLAQGENVQRWPQVLPGAKAVLYVSHTATNGYDEANIAVQPLPSGTPKVLIRGGYHAQYVSSGHIIYIHKGTLFAAPFDLKRLEITGQSVPAVEGVTTQPGTGASQFAVSQTGAFTYLSGQSEGNEAPVLWMSRDGKTSPLRSMTSDWSNPHFSPDGRKLALDISTANNVDVWVYEWARDTLTRLTFDPGDDRKPVWTPDGNRIVFSSTRHKGSANLYWQRADGTGEVQRLTEGTDTQYASSFHPSGKFLAFYENTGNGSAGNLMILPIEGDEKSGWKPGKPYSFLSTPASEQEPMFSPDGRWIAYLSNESGTGEVFVRPFPGPGGKWQISTAGGIEAAWSKTRHELLFRTPDQHIMVVSYSVEGDSFKADKPRLWSDQVVQPRNRQRAFDLHPDGDRLAVAVPAGQVDQKLDKVTFIFNFFDELLRIARPSGK